MSGLLTDHAWAGARCFVVGGGPSLVGFDWSILKRERVIAVNRAFKDIPDPSPRRTVFFTEDIRFIDLFRTDLFLWDGQKIYHCLYPTHHRDGYDTWIRYVCNHDTKRGKFWSKSFEREGLGPAGSSGAGAIQLADTLLDGIGTIYLLGFDCVPTGGKTTNYHADYPDSWRTGDQQYESYRSEFENWVAPNVRAAVFNLNPHSGLRCWPRLSTTEAALT